VYSDQIVRGQCSDGRSDVHHRNPLPAPTPTPAPTPRPRLRPRHAHACAGAFGRCMPVDVFHFCSRRFQGGEPPPPADEPKKDGDDDKSGDDDGLALA